MGKRKLYGLLVSTEGKTETSRTHPRGEKTTGGGGGGGRVFNETVLGHRLRRTS